MLLVLIKQSHSTNLISSPYASSEEATRDEDKSLIYIYISEDLLGAGSLDGELIDAVKRLVWALYGKSRQPDFKRLKCDKRGRRESMPVVQRLMV